MLLATSSTALPILVSEVKQHPLTWQRSANYTASYNVASNICQALPQHEPLSPTLSTHASP